MPRMFRGLFVAAATLLGVALAGPLPALAEMTDADRAGIRAFTACLDEDGNDEEACLEKLGRYAWYPRDETACEAVAARVHKAISQGDQAEWPDLFRNERCARLAMPHDREAGEAGAMPNSQSAYGSCMQGNSNMLECEEALGRHSFYPWYNGMCQSLSHLQSVYIEAGWGWSERGLFTNERCRRLSRPYFTPE